MRLLLSIVGIVLILLGILWTLQGLNIVRTGFMAGHLEYALLGVLAAIVGLGLIVWANRRQKSVSATPGSGLKR